MIIQGLSKKVCQKTYTGKMSKRENHFQKVTYTGKISMPIWIKNR